MAAIAEQVAVFRGVWDGRRAYLADTDRFKTAGYRGTVGYFCTYTPEELILAAGFHPVRILAEPGPAGPVDGYIQSFACSFARSCLDRALRGEYEDLEGVVFTATCDSLRNVAEAWRRYVPQGFFHFMNFPARLDAPGVEAFAATELAGLAAALGGDHGIEAARLPESAALMAEIRSLLAQLWEYRATWPRPPLSGTDSLAVFLAGLVMERRDYRDHLARLVRTIEEPGREGVPETKPAPIRLAVSGGVIEDPRTLELIEMTGATLVADDLCTGTRDFTFGDRPGGTASGSGAVAQPTPTTIPQLAHHYLSKIPCPTKHPIDRRAAHLLDVVRRSRAAGVVFLLQKFCETHAFDQPYLASLLSAQGLPALVLEIEQGGLVEGQAATRLGAFLEMIAGRREVAAGSGGAEG
ncbi:MAG TPA: 2-hydroxyacyl-CoA dehydratase family protein [Bacillota bacterium]